MIKKLLLILLLTVTLFGATSSNAATYYFSDCDTGADVACVAGDDANTGATAGTGSTGPKRSYAELFRMLESCSPGDQFLVARGAVITKTRSEVTFTNGTPGVVTWTGHNLKVGQKIIFYGSQNDALVTLPGITNQQAYFVNSILSANTFTINSGGGALNFSGTTAGGPFHAIQSGYLRPNSHTTAYALNPCIVTEYTPSWGASATKPTFIGAFSDKWLNLWGPGGGYLFKNIIVKGPIRSSAVSVSGNTITWTGHGLSNGVALHFSSTGTTPSFTNTDTGYGTGSLDTGTTVSVGVVVDANSFTLVSNSGGYPGGQTIDSIGSYTGTLSARAYGPTWADVLFGGHTLVFDGVNVSGFVFGFGSGDALGGNPSYTNTGLVFKNGSFFEIPVIGVGWFGASHSSVINNTFDYTGDGDLRNHPLYVSGSDYTNTPSLNITVEGNTLTNSSLNAAGKCTATLIVGHGVRHDWVIRRNKVINTVSAMNGGCYGIVLSAANSPPSMEFAYRDNMSENLVVNSGNIAFAWGNCDTCVIENNRAVWEAPATAYGFAMTSSTQDPFYRAWTSNGIIRNNSAYIDSCENGSECGLFLINGDGGGNHTLVNNSVWYGSGTGTGIRRVLETPQNDIISVASATNGTPLTISSYGGYFFDAAPIRFSSTGTLPGPLVAGTTYYQVGSTSSTSGGIITFSVAATKGGAAINSNGNAGSGTITITGYIPDLISYMDYNASYNHQEWAKGVTTLGGIQALGYEVNAVTALPQLVEVPSAANNYSFAIQSTSPLRNVGNSTKAPRLDRLFRIRDSQPDIGAEEYGAPATVVPGAPTRIR